MASHSGCAVIVKMDGETFENAVKRLGLSNDDVRGCIVVSEPLPIEEWCRRARLQQDDLIRNTPHWGISK